MATRAKEQIVMLVLEGVVFGINTALIGQTFHLILKKERKDRKSIILSFLLLLMFSINVVLLAIDIDESSGQFVNLDAVANSAVFTSVGDPRLGVFIMLTLINCIIGDIIVVWRVWALWGQSWKVTSLPGAFWIVSIASCVGYGNAYVNASVGENLALSDNAIAPWAIIFMASTFMTNATSVCAITYRYWTYKKNITSILGKTAGSVNSRSARTLLIIIESGFLHCVTWLVMLITYVAENLFIFVLISGIVSQLTSIYPALIIVLVCMKRTHLDYIDRFQSSTLHDRGIAFAVNNTLRGPTESHPMQPIQICVHEAQISDRNSSVRSTLIEGREPVLDISRFQESKEHPLAHV
ncbi:hypothetical protein BDW22DRAFT_1361475 [Trametopsis cervina]|nr:hypothetical protein BDW22DRAFT_1361475 [Trametopsis cervina]